MPVTTTHSPKGLRVYFTAGDWQRTLMGVFDLVDIPDGHAHRSRDTFAGRLLQASMQMERVSSVARPQQHQG
jgi:hypothetical protein